jgi:hypothetical protein
MASDLVCMAFAGAERGTLSQRVDFGAESPDQDHDDGHDQQNVEEAAHRVRRGQVEESERR